MNDEQIVQAIREHLADIIGEMHEIVHDHRHFGEAALSGVVTTYRLI